MNNEKKIGYALQTGEGKLIDFGETKMTAKVSGDVSEGTYSLIEMLHPPDVGLALHRYSDGQLSFWSSITDSERAYSDIIFNKSLILVPKEPCFTEAQSGLIKFTRPLQVGDGIDCKCYFDDFHIWPSPIALLCLT